MGQRERGPPKANQTMTDDTISRLRSDFFARLATPGYVEVMLDPVPDIVFAIKTREGRYVSVNEAWVKRCGLRHKSEALGRTARDLFPAHMAARYEAQDEKVLKTGLPLINSLDLILRIKGKAGWCLSNKVPLRDDRGKIIGIASFSKDLIEPSRAAHIDEKFAAVVDHMQANYFEQMGVDELARMAELSTAQFERRMKRVFQISAAQFISKTRIDAALQALTQTSTPLGQIAVDCGWYDHAAFSRQFKQVTGLTPSEVRQLAIEVR